MGATVAAEFLHWSFPQSLGLGTGLSELSATEVGRGGDHSGGEEHKYLDAESKGGAALKEW